jgi:putative aldouronate transport system permease protein
MVEKFSFEKEHRSRTLFKIFNYFIMILIAGIIILPTLKVFIDSIDAASGYSFKLLPTKVTLNAYIRIFNDTKLLKSFAISCYVTIVGTFLALLMTTIGAFVLTNKELPGRNIILNFILFTMLFNGGLIPTYMVVKKLGITDTLWAVILPLSINTYYLILMKNFFSDIPKSISEAAQIDGCTPIGIFLKIILPMSRPAIAAIGLFYLVAYWNDFFHYVMYITDPDLYNLQVRLRSMVLSDDRSSDSSKYAVFANTLKSAIIVVAIIPVLVVYPFIQRHFVKGLNLGAIKE